MPSVPDKFLNPDHKLPQEFKRNPGGSNENPFVNKQSFLQDLVMGPKLEKKPQASAENKSIPQRASVSREELRATLKKAYDPKINISGEANRAKFESKISVDKYGRNITKPKFEKYLKDLEKEEYHAEYKDKPGIKQTRNIFGKVYKQLFGDK